MATADGTASREAEAAPTGNTEQPETTEPAKPSEGDTHRQGPAREPSSGLCGSTTEPQPRSIREVLNRYIAKSAFDSDVEVVGTEQRIPTNGTEPVPSAIVVRSQGVDRVYPGAVDWARTAQGDLVVVGISGRRHAEYTSGAWSAVRCVWVEPEPASHLLG